MTLAAKQFASSVGLGEHRRQVVRGAVVSNDGTRRSGDPALPIEVVAQHSRGHSPENHVIGKNPTNDRARGDGRVSTELRTRKHHYVGAQPTTRTNGYGRFVGSLPPDRLV